jgi:hypothetical protein
MLKKIFFGLIGNSPIVCEHCGHKFLFKQGSNPDISGNMFKVTCPSCSNQTSFVPAKNQDNEFVNIEDSLPLDPSIRYTGSDYDLKLKKSWLALIPFVIFMGVGFQMFFHGGSIPTDQIAKLPLPFKAFMSLFIIMPLISFLPYIINFGSNTFQRKYFLGLFTGSSFQYSDLEEIIIDRYRTSGKNKSTRYKVVMVFRQDPENEKTLVSLFSRNNAMKVAQMFLLIKQQKGYTYSISSDCL